MTSDEPMLKPCPKCGGRARHHFNATPAQWIECETCGFTIAAWDECWNEVAMLLDARSQPAVGEVTEEMQIAGCEASNVPPAPSNRKLVTRIYTAMRKLEKVREG